MSDPTPAPGNEILPNPPTDADLRAMGAQVAKVDTLKNQLAAKTRELQTVSDALNKESAVLEGMRAKCRVTAPIAATPAVPAAKP